MGRTQVESVLHAAFPSLGCQRVITELVGLSLERVWTLRSREYRSRAEPIVPTRRWLLWETAADGSVVGGAVLRWQQNTHVGPKHLQGGAVLEYIAARRDKGAKGYLMVLAAEE